MSPFATVLTLTLCADPSALATHPSVVEFRRVVVVEQPKTHILHLADWHDVEREAFSADVVLKGEALEEAFAEHLATVARVQFEQRAVLESLGVKEVWAEGLTVESYPAYRAIMATLKGKPAGEIPLRYGAAGELMAEGRLVVRPAEREKEFAAANPVKGWRVVIDLAAQERREDAIVRRLAKQSGLVVLVLGADHDLAENVKRLAPGVALSVVRVRGVIVVRFL